MGDEDSGKEDEEEAEEDDHEEWEEEEEEEEDDEDDEESDEDDDDDEDKEEEDDDVEGSEEEKENENSINNFVTNASKLKEAENQSICAARPTTVQTTSCNVRFCDFGRTSENMESSQVDAKINDGTTGPVCSAGTASSAMATLNVEDDCVVSAIRVESKYSDEDDSLLKDGIWSKDKSIKLDLKCDSSPSQCGAEVHSPSLVKDEQHGAYGDEEKREDSCRSAIARIKNDSTQFSPAESDSDPDTKDDANPKKGKRRSSWGSSLDSDTDVVEAEGIKNESLDEKTDVPVSLQRKREANKPSPQIDLLTAPSLEPCVRNTSRKHKKEKSEVIADDVIKDGKGVEVTHSAKDQTTFSDKALPQTDIDNVDSNLPDEAAIKNTALRSVNDSPSQVTEIQRTKLGCGYFMSSNRHISMWCSLKNFDNPKVYLIIERGFYWGGGGGGG